MPIWYGSLGPWTYTVTHRSNEQSIRCHHSVFPILNCKWCISRCRTKTLILNIYESGECVFCGTYAENLTPSSHITLTNSPLKYMPYIFVARHSVYMHLRVCVWVLKLSQYHNVAKAAHQSQNTQSTPPSHTHRERHTYRSIIISMS